MIPLSRPARVESLERRWPQQSYLMATIRIGIKKTLSHFITRDRNLKTFSGDRGRLYLSRRLNLTPKFLFKTLSLAGLSDRPIYMLH